MDQQMSFLDEPWSVLHTANMNSVRSFRDLQFCPGPEPKPITHQLGQNDATGMIDPERHTNQVGMHEGSEQLSCPLRSPACRILGVASLQNTSVLNIFWHSQDTASPAERIEELFAHRRSGITDIPFCCAIGFEEAQEIFTRPYYQDQRSDDPEQYRADQAWSARKWPAPRRTRDRRPAVGR